MENPLPLIIATCFRWI